MMELPTPETDALDRELHNPCVLQDRYSEMMEHAQKLERERDEAREDLEFRRGLYKAQEEHLETARRERDEAREDRDMARRYALDSDHAYDLMVKAVEKAESERDEARELARQKNPNHFFWNEETGNFYYIGNEKLFRVEFIEEAAK